MRTRYRQKRDSVIEQFQQGALAGLVTIAGQDAGLHFLAHLQTQLPDETLCRRAAGQGLRLAMLSDYYQVPQQARPHVLVVNYSGIDICRLPQALERLANILREDTTCTMN